MAKERDLLPSPAMIAVQAGATISLRLGAHALAWYAMWLEPQLMQQLAALSKRHVEVLTALCRAQTRATTTQMDVLQRVLARMTMTATVAVHNARVMHHTVALPLTVPPTAV